MENIPFDIQRPTGEEGVFVASDILKNISEKLSELTAGNQPNINRISARNQTTIRKISDANQNKIKESSESYEKENLKKLESLDTDFTQIANQLQNKKSRKTKDKLNIWIEKYETYFTNGDTEKLSDLVKQMKVYCVRMKTAKENREKNRPQTNYKQILEDRHTLISFLRSKNLLKKATKGKITNKKQLLHTIPNCLVEFLDKEGYRTENGSRYTWENIKETVIMLLNKEKKSIFSKHKTKIVASFLVLICSGLLWFFFPAIVQKRNTFAQTAQIFAQNGKALIEVSQSKINQFFSYFQSDTLSNETKLQSIELKIITDKYEFYQYYAPLAIAAVKGTKLDARIPLAQAYLESGGKSELFTKYNNVLGIQAGTDWNGKVINYKTTEVINGKDTSLNINFRVYPTVYECFKDYIQKLKKPWYNGILTKNTAQEQAQCLLKYSTRREVYVNKILEELENFEVEIK